MHSTASIDTPEPRPIAPAAVRRQPPRSIDVRSASLAVLAVLATIFALRWAGAVVIPVLLGLMCSYALTPLVNRAQAWRVPRSLSAAVLLLAIAGGVASTAYALGDDATAMIESLPQAAQKLQRAVRSTRAEPESPIAKVQRAAAKLEQAAEVTAVVAPPASTNKGVPRVQVEPPPSASGPICGTARSAWPAWSASHWWCCSSPSSCWCRATTSAASWCASPARG